MLSDQHNSTIRFLAYSKLFKSLIALTWYVGLRSNKLIKKIRNNAQMTEYTAGGRAKERVEDVWSRAFCVPIYQISTALYFEVKRRYEVLTAVNSELVNILLWGYTMFWSRWVTPKYLLVPTSHIKSQKTFTFQNVSHVQQVLCVWQCTRHYFPCIHTNPQWYILLTYFK